MINNKGRQLNIGQYSKRQIEHLIDLDSFKHYIAIGKSGAGKTVSLKNIAEEMLLNNVPVVVLDPQGDWISMAQPNDYDRKNSFMDYVDVNHEKIEMRVFTPASEDGIPLSINPLKQKKVHYKIPKYKD